MSVSGSGHTAVHPVPPFAPASPRELGAERKAIRRWLALGRAPTWAKPLWQDGVLSACASHLNRRWAEGCSNAAPLSREMIGFSFTGAYTAVRGWA